MPRQRFISRRGSKQLGIMEDGVLHKVVRKSAHLYRKLDAWAIDSRALQEWLNKGLHTIVITDVEEGIRYTTSMADFMQQATPILHGEHGPQKALPREYWHKEVL